MNEPIDYQSFKNLLTSYCTDKGVSRAKKLSYALWILSTVKEHDKNLALGFAQGYLGIDAQSF